MYFNRIKAFLQPPTNDEAEAKLLAAFQREGQRRLEAERRAAELAKLLRKARCRRCGERCCA